MTTTEQPSPPPVVQVPIEHRRKSRAVPVAIGGALAVAGSVIALAGGGLLAATGDDGTVGSGYHQVSTPTAALVTDAAKFEQTDDIASAVGQPKIGVSANATNDGPAKFVGIGPAKDVDRYLSGVGVDKVNDFDVAPYHLGKERTSGTRTPAAPTAQDFWVSQSAGTRADINWKVRDGSYKVVVMNADGSRGVTANGHFEVGSQYLSTVALSALLAGIMLLGGGGVVLARSIR